MRIPQSLCPRRRPSAPPTPPPTTGLDGLKGAEPSRGCERGGRPARFARGRASGPQSTRLGPLSPRKEARVEPQPWARPSRGTGLGCSPLESVGRVEAPRRQAGSEVRAPQPSFAGPGRRRPGRTSWARRAGRSGSLGPAPPPADGARASQPRGGSDTQRPWRGVQAPPLGSRCECRRLSRFPLVVTSGHPQERRPRSADCPAGALPLPLPQFPPRQSPERWEILRGCSARKGGAGRSGGAGL